MSELLLAVEEEVRMPAAGLVQVVFVEAASGRELARTELAAARLPASFEEPTRLDLGGSTWEVVRADPPTAAAFVPGGKVRSSIRCPRRRP